MLFYFCHKIKNVVKAFASMHRFSAFLLTGPSGELGCNGRQSQRLFLFMKKFS
nr:MAG TPA: hypothetical protein [Caudoviricetes sp.]